MPHSRLPTIGLTMASVPAEANRSARLAQNLTYIQAVIRAGGLPLLIPHLEELALLRAAYERLDGLLLPGGEDIHPSHFREAIHERCRSISPERDATELPLARWAVDEGKPVLGICRGVQVLNVALGGSLYQDIGAQCPGAGRHDWYPGFPRNLMAHGAALAEGSALARILGGSVVAVNSLHHQSVKDVAPVFFVTAVAPDGVVEGVQARDHPFAIGVQWHPEELAATDAGSQRLFEALVRGYLQTAAGFLTRAERDHLVPSGKLITFEIGIRFLTDYLEGDNYFKVHREGHNLDRCRTQFKLVESIEQQEAPMTKLVEEI
jgi:putative glutamine amidotransferase